MSLICPKCIDDDYLSEYIQENGEPGECSYCSNISSPVIYLDNLLGVIRSGVETEYDHPENGLGWDKGWIEANSPVYEGYDLVHDVLGLGGSKAIEDIVSHFIDEQWCRKEFYGYSDTDKMWYTWEAFKRQVCHRSRYVFLLDDVQLEEQLEYKTPSQILSTIDHYIDDYGFISTLPKGSTIYRARASKDHEKFQRAIELGTPKPEQAKYSNRFSPAGIPMFYGSADPETCIDEIVFDPCTVSLSEWNTCRDFNLVDFTSKFQFSNGRHHYREYPSIYDTYRQNQAVEYSFLLKFANDLIKPITKDGLENIEYVPTQIVVEFFHRVSEQHKKIDGFSYYSSKNGKINYVIFAEQENCFEATLSIFPKEQMLSMNPEKMKYIEMNHISNTMVE